MAYNKIQRLIAFLYIIGVVIIFTYLTPTITLSVYGSVPKQEYSNFFSTPNQIQFTKFYIELGVFTFLMIFLIIILKSAKTKHSI